ncbi:hypothetical protein Tco_0821654 [Tanacetum coccineum]|uniref:Uncharacterized protein n=1 Tax=Tanacetum coccineum TaxID=301880 RepID=A0ABQ5ACV0_9ASTR
MDVTVAVAAAKPMVSTMATAYCSTKYIKLDIHFVRDFVAKGLVRVMHVPSRYQYAEIFTKGLPSALFKEFRSSLNVRRPPAPTVGASMVHNMHLNITQSVSGLWGRVASGSRGIVNKGCPSNQP